MKPSARFEEHTTALDEETLRSLIEWNRDYQPEWDATPGEYANSGIVAWARSKRLGMYRRGRVKAYIGVQHVDPSLANWDIVEAPEARFFVSLFVNGRVLTLRTFPTMPATLTFLLNMLNSLSR